MKSHIKYTPSPHHFPLSINSKQNKTKKKKKNLIRFTTTCPIMPLPYNRCIRISRCVILRCIQAWVDQIVTLLSPIPKFPHTSSLCCISTSSTRAVAPFRWSRVLAPGCLSLSLKSVPLIHQLQWHPKFAYLTILGQINLERLRIIFESKGCHREQDIFSIDCLTLFLLAFLRSYGCQYRVTDEAFNKSPQPSLVMNEMNSLTHSCMHSFASFAIFAFSGKANFMIRATKQN